MPCRRACSYSRPWQCRQSQSVWPRLAVKKQVFQGLLDGTLTLSRQSRQSRQWHHQRNATTQWHEEIGCSWTSAGLLDSWWHSNLASLDSQVIRTDGSHSLAIGRRVIILNAILAQSEWPCFTLWLPSLTGWHCESGYPGYPVDSDRQGRSISLLNLNITDDFRNDPGHEDKRCVSAEGEMMGSSSPWRDVTLS